MVNGQATRQMKHLEQALAERNVPLPAVKLDLAGGGCKSAIAGIMYQPAKDKICSFQAVVMALLQTGWMSQSFCDQLSNDLHAWLGYILKIKVPKLIFQPFLPSIKRKLFSFRYLYSSSVLISQK